MLKICNILLIWTLVVVKTSSSTQVVSQRLTTTLTAEQKDAHVANCTQIRHWFAALGSGSGQQDSSAPACRCYSAGHRDYDLADPTWIGCEKSNMYPIVNILNRLPNNTRISKLFIWDCAMPKVPAALLTHVRPVQLKIEASTVRELAEDLFAQVGQRLKVIELRNNNLKKISARQFVRLDKLMTLDLSGNNLTQLTKESFGPIVSLERLSVQRNNISHLEDFAFAELTNLKFLSLASNRIRRITANTLAGLGSLEILSLENNTIVEIDANAFLHTPKLQQLNLGSNQLSRLSLKNLPNLRTLLIHQNRFVSLSAIETGNRPLMNLESFYADKNNISEVTGADLQSMPALVTLSLNQNHIENIDGDAFTVTRSLGSLSLENNRLTNIADDVLQPLRQLRVLQLSHNLIETIGESTFSQLTSLRKLLLSHNSISAVHEDAFVELNTLERLYLDHNLLTALKNGTFAHMEPRRMQTIDMSNNPWNCDCALVWLADWLRANQKLAYHVDQIRCAVDGVFTLFDVNAVPEQQKPSQPQQQIDNKPSLQIFEVTNQLKCIEDERGQMVDENAQTHSVWITVIGLVLAVASLMAITSIVVLYIHDYRNNGGYLLFSRGAFDLRRVPSDMVNLIGATKTKAAQQGQQTTPSAPSILATGARTNRAIDESIIAAQQQQQSQPPQNPNRLAQAYKQKLVRFNDEPAQTQLLQPITEEVVAVST